MADMDSDCELYFLGRTEVQRMRVCTCIRETAMRGTDSDAVGHTVGILALTVEPVTRSFVLSFRLRVVRRSALGVLIRLRLVMYVARSTQCPSCRGLPRARWCHSYSDPERVDARVPDFLQCHGRLLCVCMHTRTELE